MLNYYQEQKPKAKAINTNVVLYIGDLPPDVDQYELHQFIQSFGKFNIESLLIKPTKDNKSFAYVKFKTKSEVEKARNAIHLKEIRGHIIRADNFKGKESMERNEEANLFIKNLPQNTNTKEIFDLFSTYGNVVSIKLKQNEKGECIGYGYVNFDKSESAKAALENLNNYQFKGKELYVSLFSSKGQRNEEERYPLVLIKQIPPSITSEKELDNLFGRFGRINFSALTKNENGAGIVLFENKDDAHKAVQALQGRAIDGSGVQITLNLSPVNVEILEKLRKAKQEKLKNRYEGCNLVVKNIPKEIEEKSLFEIFRQFGEVSSARISTEPKFKEIKNEKGEVIDKEFVYESKGYGFVLFKKTEDAKNAKINLNNIPIDYKNIKVKLSIEFYDYNKEEKPKGQKKPRVREDNPTPKVINRPHHHKGGDNKRQYNNNRQHYSNQQHNPDQSQAQQLPQQVQPQQQRFRIDNVEFVSEIQKILMMKNPDERHELLGETIFYFLLKFIPQNNLNITGGRFDDTILCSKLTGILLHTDPNELVEIVSNLQVLTMTIRDVIMQLLQLK